MRRELEGLAVELVEQRATAADLDLLDRLIAQMREAAREENLQSSYRSDLEFHRTLWWLSGNRFLLKSLDITVVPLFAFFIMKKPRDSATDLVASVERHAEVDAIRRRDEARKCMDSALEFFAQQENRLLFERGKVVSE